MERYVMEISHRFSSLHTMDTDATCPCSRLVGLSGICFASLTWVCFPSTLFWSSSNQRCRSCLLFQCRFHCSLFNAIAGIFFFVVVGCNFCFNAATSVAFRHFFSIEIFDAVLFNLFDAFVFNTVASVICFGALSLSLPLILLPLPLCSNRFNCFYFDSYHFFFVTVAMVLFEQLSLSNTFTVPSYIVIDCCLCHFVPAFNILICWHFQPLFSCVGKLPLCFVLTLLSLCFL